MKKIKSLLALLVTGLAVFTGQAATLNIIHSFGPDTAAFQADFVEKLATGNVPDGMPTTSFDARRVPALFPEHVMLKSDGKGFAWLGIVLTAGPGEMVSLSDTSVSLRSFEDGDPGFNRLGKSLSYAGDFYSPMAPGIRLDGSRITEGSADQRVNGKVVLAVGYLSLPVNTSGGESTVRSWFYANNVRLTSTVSALGVTNQLVLRQLPPSLSASVVGGRLIVAAENTGDPRNYEVQTAPTVEGPWVGGDSTLRAGQSLDLGPTTQPARFVRLVAPIP